MRTKHSFLSLIFTFFVLSLSACASYTPGPVSKTLTPENEGTIWFASNDGYDLTKFSTAPEIIVEGDLTIPTNHNGGTVILSHGSDGKGSLHNNWRDFLNENGFAVFLLDHFRPRKTINVLHSQVKVTEQQMAYDVLNASSLIQTHPSINKNRIYHMGWSKGATAGIVASFDKVREMVTPGNTVENIAGFIEFYPWCGLRAELSTYSPVLIMHGTKDNYTPLSLCETLVADMDKAGSNIRIERFQNSVHGFDDWNKKINTQDSITIRKASDDCTLKIDPQTLEIRSINKKFSVDTYDNRKDFLSNCAERGAKYGGSPEHRSRTKKLVLEFLSR